MYRINDPIRIGRLMYGIVTSNQDERWFNLKAAVGLLYLALCRNDKDCPHETLNQVKRLEAEMLADDNKNLGALGDLLERQTND